MMNRQPPGTDADPVDQRARVRHPEAELLRRYGSHTLSFFGLAPKNRHFLTPDGEGLVNYRVTRKVVVVLGDPVCAAPAVERVMRCFLDFCAQQKWDVACYQVCPQHLDAYRALHLHAFKMGEEARLNPQTFTLRGAGLANVRTSSRRAEREGVHIQWYEGVPPFPVLQQLECLSNAWLEHKAGKRAGETGFSVGHLEDLTEMAEQAEMIATHAPLSTVSKSIVPRFLTAVAMTDASTACAFLTFTPIYGCVTSVATGDHLEGVGAWGWALDLTRRTPTTPPGVMELLLVRAIERFRACGANVLSLGLVAWSDTLQEMTPVQRTLARFVTDRLHLGDPHHSLFPFKQKFHPRWESRYLVTRTTLALPKVALAIFRVRNYAGRGEK
jgi:phosphatidylglycerol lysyltransferase